MAHHDLHRRLHTGQQELWQRVADRRDAVLARLQDAVHPGYTFPWRVAEAPAVVPRGVFEQDVARMRALLVPYFEPEFRGRYAKHVPERYRRPDDSGWFPRFIATDFQRAWDADAGEFTWGVPEIQSFPGNVLLKPLMLRSLRPELDGVAESDLFLDEEVGGFEEYLGLVRTHVLDGFAADETVIVELQPMAQKTVVDMLLFARYLGLAVVALEDVRVDPATGEAYAESGIVFEDGMPRRTTWSRPRVLRNILCRALPDEIDAAVGPGPSALDPSTLEALFQGTLDRGTVRWVVHPQDFFVLSKETLVGNPHHAPPLLPVTDGLPAQLAAAGWAPTDGVVKPLHQAGGRGLEGFGGALDAARLRELARSPGAYVWQRRYGADPFAPPAVSGREDPRPLYHELRLMWATTTAPDTGDVRLRLLCGLTRWNRVGDPANASWAKTPFTGTHGLLVADV
ncbi:MAG: hypothetical protein CMJ83_06200 [Planctomycetes bacterium]|nr:hypothetical protein [Planctomycetota bacterium]